MKEPFDKTQDKQQNVVNDEQQDITQVEPVPLSSPLSHKKLIIGIVAVFVVVGMAGAYFVLQSKADPANNVETVLSAETVEPESTTNEIEKVDISDWKMYRNEEFGFQLKYSSSYRAKFIEVDGTDAHKSRVIGREVERGLILRESTNQIGWYTDSFVIGDIFIKPRTKVGITNYSYSTNLGEIEADHRLGTKIREEEHSITFSAIFDNKDGTNFVVRTFDENTLDLILENLTFFNPKVPDVTNWEYITDQNEQVSIPIPPNYRAQLGVVGYINFISIYDPELVYDKDSDNDKWGNYFNIYIINVDPSIKELDSNDASEQVVQSGFLGEKFIEILDYGAGGFEALVTDRNLNPDMIRYFYLYNPDSNRALQISRGTIEFFENDPEFRAMLENIDWKM